MTQTPTPGTTRRDVLRAGAVGLGAVGGATLLPGAGALAAEEPIPTAPVLRYFVKVGTILGGSQVIGHEDWIDVLAWQFGATSTSSPLGSGGGPSKSKPGDFVFWARSGAATPLLWQAVAVGQKFTKAELHVVHVNDLLQTFYAVVFNQLFLTSYQVDTGASDGRPVDVIRADYAKATYIVREQHGDGSLGPEIRRGFDFLNNVKA